MRQQYEYKWFLAIDTNELKVQQNILLLLSIHLSAHGFAVAKFLVASQKAIIRFKV